MAWGEWLWAALREARDVRAAWHAPRPAPPHSSPPKHAPPRPANRHVSNKCLADAVLHSAQVHRPISFYTWQPCEICLCSWTAVGGRRYHNYKVGCVQLFLYAIRYILSPGVYVPRSFTFVGRSWRIVHDYTYQWLKRRGSTWIQRSTTLDEVTCTACALAEVSQQLLFITMITKCSLAH